MNGHRKAVRPTIFYFKINNFIHEIKFYVDVIIIGACSCRQWPFLICFWSVIDFYRGVQVQDLVSPVIPGQPAGRTPFRKKTGYRNQYLENPPAIPDKPPEIPGQSKPLKYLNERIFCKETPVGCFNTNGPPRQRHMQHARCLVWADTDVRGAALTLVWVVTSDRGAGVSRKLSWTTMDVDVRGTVHKLRSTNYCGSWRCQSLITRVSVGCLITHLVRHFGRHRVRHLTGHFGYTFFCRWCLN